MTNLFWQLQQSRQIAEAQNEASAAMNEASRQTRHIDELEQRLARTSLACQALWELVQAHMGLTEAQLVGKMNEIDARDGIKDGKVTPVMIDCPKCGRKVNTKSPRCLYCGSTVAKPSVFQG